MTNRVYIENVTPDELSKLILANDDLEFKHQDCSMVFTSEGDHLYAEDIDMPGKCIFHNGNFIDVINSYYKTTLPIVELLISLASIGMELELSDALNTFNMSLNDLKRYSATVSTYPVAKIIPDFTSPDYEKGYEDIHSTVPYIDWEWDQNRAIINILYVPLTQRFNGYGKKLVKNWLLSLPNDIEYVRLKSCCLGSGDTLDFWKSLGFSSAYKCVNEDNLRILHLAVNNFELPSVEVVTDGEERHYFFD